MRKTALIMTGLLAALALPTAGASEVSAAKTCSSRSSDGWAVVRDYGNIAFFEQAKSGVSETKLVNTAGFARDVKSIAADIVAKAGAGAKIKIHAKGGADANGNAKSNERIAKARARLGANTLRRELRALKVKSVTTEYTHVVSTKADDPYARYVGFTVFRCDPSLLGGGTGSTAPSTPSGRCDRSTNLTLLHSEDLTFKLAKSSLREGLKAADSTLFTSRSVFMAGRIRDHLKSPGGVYIEITGYASPTGRDSSNDWLALNRAETAKSSLIKSLKKLKASTSAVTFKTIGAKERIANPIAAVKIYHCP